MFLFCTFFIRTPWVGIILKCSGPVNLFEELLLLKISNIFWPSAQYIKSPVFGFFITLLFSIDIIWFDLLLFEWIMVISLTFTLFFYRIMLYRILYLLYCGKIVWENHIFIFWGWRDILFCNFIWFRWYYFISGLDRF